MRPFAVLLLLMVTLTQAAIATPPEPVRVSLLSDHSVIAAGEAFRVGVRFSIDPGWHIYWKNPGDSGLATSVKWDLPAGFTASSLQWPTPRLFNLPGDIRNIGYTEQVMLIAEIQPPPGWRGRATIGAQVRWLVCKELCIPGRQTVRATVDVGDKPVLSNTQTFATWQERMPRPITPAIPVEGVTVEHVRQTYLVHLHEDAPIGDPAIFVSAAGDTEVTASAREQKPNSATIEITVVPKAAPAASAEAGEVVVSWNTANGVPRSVVVPLSSSTQQ